MGIRLETTVVNILEGSYTVDLKEYQRLSLPYLVSPQKVPPYSIPVKEINGPFWKVMRPAINGKPLASEDLRALLRTIAFYSVCWDYDPDPSTFQRAKNQNVPDAVGDIAGIGNITFREDVLFRFSKEILTRYAQILWGWLEYLTKPKTLEDLAEEDLRQCREDAGL